MCVHARSRAFVSVCACAFVSNKKGRDTKVWKTLGKVTWLICIIVPVPQLESAGGQ